MPTRLRELAEEMDAVYGYRLWRLGVALLGSWLAGSVLLRLGWIGDSGHGIMVVTGVVVGLLWELVAAFGPSSR